MSTIRRTIRVAGVLTDPTSVKLSSSDTTFGVKRNDTDAVVVADDTAMTQVSTGIYEHTFTDPANGLTYTYSMEIVYSGETYHVEDTLTGPTGDRYCVRADIENLFGVTNVSKWSDLDNDADATKISNRIAAAITATADMIDARLRFSRYLIPISNAGFTPTIMRDLNAQMAGVWLYESRGVIDYDADGRAMHALHWIARKAESTMKQLAAGTLVLTADLKADITGMTTAPRNVDVVVEN